MANFLNNLTQQMTNAFNSPVGLKIGKQVYSIINSCTMFEMFWLIDFPRCWRDIFPFSCWKISQKNATTNDGGAFDINDTS